MAEVSFDSLTDEEKRRFLALQDANAERDFLVNQNVIPTEQPQTQPQANLSPVMKALMGTPLEMRTMPEFGGGRVLKQIGRNAILTPIQERLGLKDTPERMVARARYATSTLANLESQLDLKAKNRALHAANYINYDGLPNDVQDEYMLRLGSRDLDGALTALREYRSGLKTNDTKEYEYARAQFELNNPNEGYKTYEEWKTSNKKKEQSIPSAVQTFNFLKELNPDIKNMAPNDQQDLLFKIIRQDVDTASLIAQAQYKAGLGGLNLTPAQKKVDELFGTDYANYKQLGGYAAAMRDLNDLDRSVKLLLESEEALTGPLVGNLPTEARSAESVNLEDEVARIVIQDLRRTLGAQFTENEGKQFIARSFNVLLPNKVNAQRLQRMRAVMQQVHDAKKAAIDYYEDKGTISGLKSTIPTEADLEKAVFLVTDYDGVDDEQLINWARDPRISNAEFEAIKEQIKKRGL
jgi:hypothetical protein